MKYLSSFKLFEMGDSPESEACLIPTQEELEQLPSFKKMVEIQEQLNPIIGSWRVVQKKPFRWGTDLRKNKGIATFDLASVYYSFKINPCRNTLYFGKEKINKNYAVSFKTLDDWNKAFKETDRFAMARTLDIKYNFLQSMLNDSQKFFKFFGREEKPLVDEAMDAIFLHLLLYHCQFPAEEELAKRVGKDIKYLKKIPHTLDRKGILIKAGYTPEEAESLLTFDSEVGF